jgi:hypothetical protein
LDAIAIPGAPGTPAIAAPSSGTTQPLPSSALTPAVVDEVAGAAVDHAAGTERPPTEGVAPKAAITGGPPSPAGIAVFANAVAAAAAGMAPAVPAAAGIVFRVWLRNIPETMPAVVNQAPVLTAPLMVSSTSELASGAAAAAAVTGEARLLTVSGTWPTKLFNPTC